MTTNNNNNNNEQERQAGTFKSLDEIKKDFDEEFPSSFAKLNTGRSHVISVEFPQREIRKVLTKHGIRYAVPVIADGEPDKEWLCSYTTLNKLLEATNEFKEAKTVYVQYDAKDKRYNIVPQVSVNTTKNSETKEEETQETTTEE
jgi:hypothetical protein